MKMRDMTFHRRMLFLFAFIMSCILIISTGCSTDNETDPTPPIDNGNNGNNGEDENGDGKNNGNEGEDNEGNDNEEENKPGPYSSLKLILNEMEKQGNLSLFAEALQQAGIEDTEEALTVFAVENSAFEEGGSSGILHHVVKGAYTPEMLRNTSQLGTVDGHTLEVEYIDMSREDGIEPILYINHTIIPLTGRAAGENIIYTTNAFLPTSTQLPNENDEDFLKILSRKIEGEWRIREHRIFEIIYEDYNRFYVNEITGENIHSFCFETFYWNPSSNISGEYELAHSGDHTGTEMGHIGSNWRKTEGGWRLRKSSEENAIAYLDFCFWLINSYRSAVSFPLDKQTGIGTHMKYIVQYPGESLSPPNMYPSRRTEHTYLLQKTKNKP